MLRLSLESAGFQVTEADSGTKALHILEHRPPDALILDPSLPDNAGLVILEKLSKVHHIGYRIPAWVVISALDWEEATQRYGPLGRHFITKPFDPWVLIDRFEDQLSAMRAE